MRFDRRRASHERRQSDRVPAVFAVKTAIAGHDGTPSPEIQLCQADNAIAANNLAYILLEHGGDPNLALSLAQTGRKGMTDSPNSADTLAWAYYRTGAYTVAAPLLEAAVKKVPTNPTYQYHLGMVYQKLNDHAKAKSAFEAAIRAKPDSPAADSARKALSELAGT